MKLIDVVTNLSSHDTELTIYARKPWSCDSLAVVAHEPDEGGIPHEAELLGAEYFMEVFVVAEFLEEWVASDSPPKFDVDRCERLIRYAIDDA